ncbi:protein FAR1-RELATED SEQUENCE 5-like [Ziziphus jujuba]|uniref:Protein FAR1-RELATED SEQUENCE 5-like n=1 Tax=Ziziphus jujuba TaxID=326968 RepID=A0ABM4ADR0_ZIZJJ|nr:protein FAR1-RELATED SEQUENCE 5-like [Ziziphus jujuba]
MGYMWTKPVMKFPALRFALLASTAQLQSNSHVRMAGQISPEPFPFTFPLSPARKDFAKIPIRTSSNQPKFPIAPAATSIAILANPPDRTTIATTLPSCKRTCSHHDCHPSLYPPAHNLLLCMSIFWFFVSVGQEFESIDGAHEFYIKYAKEAGFSVRSNSTKRCKGVKEVVRKQFVCFKEGVSSIKDDERKRCRGMTRENCKAKLAVVRSKTGKFVITVFVEEHSHPLSTPRRVHLLRSHRSVSEAKKSLTLQFSAANVPTHQQISILEFEAGGIENIGCTKKDIYNHEAKVWNELRGQDAELLKEYFLTEQEKDPCFFFKIDVDDDGKLKRCFWADSVSRRAYGCFGDVVVFDTTYNTNQYGMIFAPLVGVNNHGQTVLFACAFLSDEKTESFVWYCSWHMLEKFSTYLNAITYRDFYKDFQQCIWESECPEEFERKWVTTIEKASLNNTDWLKSIFELRSRWVPAYVNHIFSAGMSSSQRAESSHAFFKKYVSKRNLLMDFILRFNSACTATSRRIRG